MNERDIFIEALEKASPEERRSFLDRTCGDDARLRSRLELLLQSHEKPNSLLDHPILGDSPTETLGGLTDGPQRDASEDGTVDLDFLEPPNEPDSLGRLAQYEVRSVIGRGGMGIVLRAYDTKLNRVVAVKVLAPELAANATARKRFLREARTAASVSHDHVVTIYAVEDNASPDSSPGGTDRRCPYLVMEFIDGLSLEQKIEREGHLELKEILRIGRQIAAGLAAAHQQGLIHRDIKPSNILLQNSVERVKITDFGLARAVDDLDITRTGEIAGTPQYMSPEQAEAKPVDARSDLFSLGSVLYAMCTGRSPFRAETTMASLRRVCDDTPRPIRQINPDIPEWLVAIVDRLLEKAPDHRFQTADEVADLLSRHLAHLQNPQLGLLPDPVSPAKSRSPRHTLGRRHWAIAATVMLCVVVLATMTEATGVTNLAATVIRIATGEGTLVIEVDDPSVQVSIDGEQLSITGAGIQELKLRPGEYKLRATKSGLPVRTEVVSVTRGGRQVIRVSREPPASSLPEKFSESETSELDFVSLFDGKTLNGWQGNTAAYSVEDGSLISHGRGNLFTTREYRDFILRFEYRFTTTAANSGVAIRSPLSGDPAYEGFEIQILDDSAYRILPAYNANGSIWGVAAAKPGSLRMFGEWNHEEIRCVGRSVRVTLNDTIILDVDLDSVAQPADGRPHPGLERQSGYIGLMGNTSAVEFRTFRIKEVPGKTGAKR